MSEIVKDVEFYRNILNQMVEGYVMQASDGSIIDYNQAACEILGLTPDQLKGKTSMDPDWSCIKEDFTPFPGEEHPSMVALATGRRQKDILMGVHTPDKVLKWIQINSFPLFNNDSEKPFATYTTFKNITNEIQQRAILENKTMELELATERLNLALSETGFGVWDFNPNSGDLKWDHRMLALFDCSEEEFEGAYEAWESRLHPDDLEDAKQSLARALSGEEDFKTRFRILDSKGNTKFIGGIAKVIRDKKGQAERMVGINWDLSDQVNYEEGLKKAKIIAEEAARAKSSFLANMSHEIRTPMNGILGMMSVLLETELSQEQEEIVETVNNSSRTLLVILNDILDISKIESGKLSIENEIFSLENTIKMTSKLYEKTASMKNLTFEVNTEVITNKRYRGDSNRISQVLNNLLSNAIKFTEKGFIKVNSLITNNGILIEVLDSGIGIENSKLDQLFNPFVQADSSITRKYGGTGLGLSISLKLAQIMKGSITVESDVDKGTTFSLFLPLKETHEEVLQRQMKSTPEDRARLQVLIVEDNPVNIMVLQKSLEKMGIKPEIASNGLEAVNACKTKVYDYILMDLQMPIMDGITASKKILKNINGKRPKIIALTANVFEEDRAECLEAGMDDFLTKPIHLDILKTKIV